MKMTLKLCLCALVTLLNQSLCRGASAALTNTPPDGGAGSAKTAPTNTAPLTGKFDLQFHVSPPYSTSGEVARRFSAGVLSSAYTLAKERFQVIVPETYTNDLTWGLLVWISPGHEPNIPNDWPDIFAKHKLLFVSPLNAGNDRHPGNQQAGAVERFRLALDASYNMRLRYRISPKRIYVSGFSGGGRVASMLGVAFSDVFTGTIPICGVNFYMTLPAGGDQEWKADYKTQTPYLTKAKTTGRFVLIIGDNDINRVQTSASYQSGFKQYGFAYVEYVQVPGMGHAIPSGQYLDRALDFLDAGRISR
jgi:poly(3-hydroxybutyrate) depolymerase